jgi:hypothetical protein
MDKEKYLLEVLRNAYENYQKEDIKDKSTALGKLEGMIEFTIAQLGGEA